MMYSHETLINLFYNYNKLFIFCCDFSLKKIIFYKLILNERHKFTNKIII